MLLATSVFPRSLDALLTRFAREDARGTEVEAWLFEGEAARRSAERALARFGVRARLRSSYKPLISFVLEEADMRDAVRAELRYPVHPAAPPSRFRLESYPLAALLPPAPLRLLAGESGADDAPAYKLVVETRSGCAVRHRVAAPNRRHLGAHGTLALSPTGRLAVDGRAEPLLTETEALFAEALRVVEAWDWPERPPFFAELRIRAEIPCPDRPLGVGTERISLAEALHEDLYFAVGEVLRRRCGVAPGDRRFRPGQIVPEVRTVEGPARLRIETRPLDRRVWPALGPAAGADLAEARASVAAAEVHAALRRIGGAPLEGRSVAGRPVRARLVRGTDRPMILTGGQHGNEPSGIVGALRAAKLIAGRPGAHLVVCPLENPDGHALHLRLSRLHPRHMHHAARYTALGDDLGHRSSGSEPGEERIRQEAQRLCDGRAWLHASLHGYPAHEWTRPFSGYVPAGFAAWTIPRGFFLLLRHRRGWAGAARFLAERVAGRVVAVPGLTEFNRRQLALFQRHSGQRGFRTLHGIPVRIEERAGGAAPITLTTEWPDETIYGAAFVQAHTVQAEAALASYEALQALPPALVPLAGEPVVRRPDPARRGALKPAP